MGRHADSSTLAHLIRDWLVMRFFCGMGKIQGISDQVVLVRYHRAAAVRGRISFVANVGDLAYERG
jgi:hypothetical protein